MFDVNGVKGRKINAKMGLGAFIEGVGGECCQGFDGDRYIYKVSRFLR